MKNDDVLFKIRVLEKLVLRNVFLNGDTDVYKTRPTPTQMHIIDYMLMNMDRDVYQRDLENVLKLKRATVSGVLQTMEKNGLISRSSSVYDTRVKKIVLNEKTKEIFIKNQERFKYLESVIIDGISKRDLKVFMRVIDEMIDNIELITFQNERR